MIVSAHRLNELLDAALEQLEAAEAQLDRVLAIREEGATEERAAVVAWLREGNKQTLEWDERENAVSRTYRVCADAIERGEHRREEGA